MRRHQPPGGHHGHARHRRRPRRDLRRRRRADQRRAGPHARRSGTCTPAPRSENRRRPAGSCRRTSCSEREEPDGGNVIFGFGGNLGDCEPYHGWIIWSPKAAAPPRSTTPRGHCQRHPGGRVAGRGGTRGRHGRQHLGRHGQRVSGPLRRQRFGLRAVAPTGAQAALCPERLVRGQLERPGPGLPPPALLPNGTAFHRPASPRPATCSARRPSGASAARAADDHSGVPERQCRRRERRARVDHRLTSPATGRGSGHPGPSRAERAVAGRRRHRGWHRAPIAPGASSGSLHGATLDALDPTTGATAPERSTSAGEANHFPTPSVGDGLLLAPSTDQVYAFSGSAGLPGPPSPAPSTPANSSYWIGPRPTVGSSTSAAPASSGRPGACR